MDNNFKSQCDNCKHKKTNTSCKNYDRIPLFIKENDKPCKYRENKN